MYLRFHKGIVLDVGFKQKRKSLKTACLSYFQGLVCGRGRRDRTLGTRFWRPLLYQLSYTPIEMVGHQGLEPRTNRL